MKKTPPTKEAKDLFLKELKELLKKHSADISADVDGDTHGVSVAITLEVCDTEVLRVYGYWLSHNDIN